MIEFKISNLLNSSIRDLSVIADRRTQSCIVHLFFGIMAQLGFNQVSLLEATDAVNILLKSSSLDGVTQDIFKAYLNFISRNYHLPLSFSHDCVNLSQFGIVDDDQSLSISSTSLDNCISKIFGSHYPIYLVEELERLRKEVNRLKSIGQIEFLSTSALHRRKEISDKLGQMVTRAREHVYIMLAFYEEDVLFFAKLLEQCATMRELDLRIIYNSRGKKNRELVLKLIHALGQRDFFRSYNKKYVDPSFKRAFIGNLHSKLVVTESEILVGSANMTQQALYFNVENALYTNDKWTVESGRDFFLSVWGMLRTPDAI